MELFQNSKDQQKFARHSRNYLIDTNIFLTFKVLKYSSQNWFWCYIYHVLAWQSIKISKKSEEECNIKLTYYRQMSIYERTAIITSTHTVLFNDPDNGHDEATILRSSEIKCHQRLKTARRSKGINDDDNNRWLLVTRMIIQTLRSQLVSIVRCQVKKSEKWLQ